MGSNETIGLWPYVKHVLELFYKIGSLYKFKFLIFTAMGIYIYSCSWIFVSTEGNTNLTFSSSTDSNVIEGLVMFLFASFCIWIDVSYQNHSRKILKDIILSPDVDLKIKKDAMKKLSDIQ